MDNINQILKITDEIQKECHEYVNHLQEAKSTASYEDMTYVYIFHKLAQQEFRLRQLENKK